MLFVKDNQDANHQTPLVIQLVSVQESFFVGEILVEQLSAEITI